jgi:hypothetical protein
MGATMKSTLLVFGLLAAIGWGVPGMAAEPRFPLRVMYLGNEGTPRATEFIDFLRVRFEQVAAKNRADLDLESVGAYDVVLLDWSQTDTDSEKAVSPLGPRLQWSKPTVLLGSAGHLLATPWEIIGGAG